jgi:hypothetical protein
MMKVIKGSVRMSQWRRMCDLYRIPNGVTDVYCDCEMLQYELLPFLGHNLDIFTTAGTASPIIGKRKVLRS